MSTQLAIKSKRLEFQDMLYEKLSSDSFLDGEGRPVALEIGHGVLPSATSRTFTNGNLNKQMENLMLPSMATDSLS